MLEDLFWLQIYSNFSSSASLSPLCISVFFSLSDYRNSRPQQPLRFLCRFTYINTKYNIIHNHFYFESLKFFTVSALRGNFRQKSLVWTWKSVRLTEVSVLPMSVLQRFFNEKDTYVLMGNVKVSVLERFPSDAMSVLRGFTV